MFDTSYLTKTQTVQKNIAFKLLGAILQELFYVIGSDKAKLLWTVAPWGNSLVAMYFYVVHTQFMFCATRR